MAKLENVDQSITEIIAATSKTPFKTAFMVTLGMGAAQLLFGMMLFAAFAATICTIVYFVRH